MLDACNVEEVVLVVGDEIAFHLSRVHTAVRLRHIDDRQVQIRKNAHRHADQRQDRAQSNTDDGHQDGDGPSHRDVNKPHTISLFCLIQERLQIAPSSCRGQKRAPNVQPCDRVVDLGLGQQPLGLGHFGDGG